MITELIGLEQTPSLCRGTKHSAETKSYESALS